MNDSYFQAISYLLFFSLAAFATNFYAWKRKFFHLQELGRAKWVQLTWPHVVLYFVIYIGSAYALEISVPYWLYDFSTWLNIQLPLTESGYNAVFQVAHSLLLLCFLFLFSLTLEGDFLGRIIKDKKRKHIDPLWKDFILGCLTWLLAFPLIAFFSEISDFAIDFLFGPQVYEQAAVVYLKSAQEAPWIALIAFVSIVIIAPMVEEFLFRGILLSYFKKLLGVKSAIGLSAIIFALFHYTSSQGHGNISLILSLFIFALFLGFIYERQGSLLASIGLHMTFNTISTMRILFAPDF